MELRQLRYFVAVVEAGTVTGAAEQLAMSQPPLTMQLHNLEAELGCSLFAREGRRLRLTEAGAVFYRRAKTILALAEAAAGEMAGHGTGRLGTLRLGTISSVQGSMLPDWAAAFSARYPQVRLELHTADTYQQLEALRAGQIDVAVVRTPFSAPELEQLPLALERMLAAALPGRLPPQATLEALSHRPLVLYRRWERVLQAQFEAAGAVMEVRCCSDDAQTTLALAARGLGIGVVPASALPDPAVLGLEARVIDAPQLATRIVALCRSRALLPRPAALFWDLLAQWQADAPVTRKSEP